MAHPVWYARRQSCAQSPDCNSVQHFCGELDCLEAGPVLFTKPFVPTLSRTLQLSSQTLLKTHQEKGTLISQLRPISCFLNNMFNIKTLNTTRPHSLLNLPHYSFSWKAGRLLFIDFIHWDKVTLTQLFKLNVACKTKWNIWLSDCSAIRSDFLPPVSH